MTGCRPASSNCPDTVSSARNREVDSTYSVDRLYLSLALEGNVHLSNTGYLSVHLQYGISGCGLLLELITLIHLILVLKEHPL